MKSLMIRNSLLTCLTISAAALMAAGAQADTQNTASGPAYVIENGQISDSLVDHLDCSTLSRDNVLNKVQPGAFSIKKHMNRHNWSSGLLAQCWSLSHTQRLVFYLGRTGSHVDPSQSQQNIENVLNMIRGTVPLDMPPQDGVSYAEKPTELKVFPIPGKSINSSLYDELQVGISSSGAGHRSLTSEIEHYEQVRFGSISNFSLLAGKSRETSDTQNEKTIQQIASDIARNRLPLIVIRASMTLQHVVLVKRIEQTAADSYKLIVYDSNYPTEENSLTYQDKKFYAPNFTYDLGVDNPDAPVGVFIKDESDLDDIQDTLFSYYKNICQSVR